MITNNRETFQQLINLSNEYVAFAGEDEGNLVTGKLILLSKYCAIVNIIKEYGEEANKPLYDHVKSLTEVM